MTVLFQSLFSWNSLFDSTSGMPAVGAGSFNPCFPGTRSSTLGILVQRAVSLKFQSLFSWNSLFDAIVCSVSRSGQRFQSLFSWNSLFDVRRSEVEIMKVRSFNPCFPGTRSSTCLLSVTAAIWCIVSILVFLELALRHSL